MTAAPQTTDEPVAPGSGGDGLVRLRLDLGYDGSRFSGWARQPALRTVQETIERALGTVLRLGGSAALTVAGRTDAGVHARGQVAHAEVPTSKRGGRHVARQLNGVLPEDVRIYGVAVAPPGFDARFSALSRRYAYRVSDDPVALDPLRRHDVLWHKRPLDLVAMNEAASSLIGVHDFAAFCRKREGATTVRDLLDVTWARDERGLAVASIQADAFCHNMVRALVGALLAVGDGRRPADWPAAVLALGVRDPSVPVVSPHGLTLEEVRYPETAEAMAARAVESRRLRR